MREHAHQLLDRLDDSRLAAVIHLLEAFTAEDPDYLTPDEARCVAEAEEWLKHNKPIPHEEILAEFGLTAADFEEIDAK